MERRNNKEVKNECMVLERNVQKTPSLEKE
jgi:hypothetical protein